MFCVGSLWYGNENDRNWYPWCSSGFGQSERRASQLPRVSSWETNDVMRTWVCLILLYTCFLKDWYRERAKRVDALTLTDDSQRVLTQAITFFKVSDCLSSWTSIYFKSKNKKLKLIIHNMNILNDAINRYNLKSPPHGTVQRQGQGLSFVLWVDLVFNIDNLRKCLL